MVFPDNENKMTIKAVMGTVVGNVKFKPIT